MNLNTLRPAEGSKKAAKRLGRGIGSGFGKTCGRGHKGQKARAGGYHKVGFEGGQMPLQRRLPKFGFYSRKSAHRAELRLSDLNKMIAEEVNLVTLQESNLIGHSIQWVKIIGTGELKKRLHVQGLLVSKGAKAAIEAAGGTVGTV